MKAALALASLSIVAACGGDVAEDPASAAAGAAGQSAAAGSAGSAGQAAAGSGGAGGGGQTQGGAAGAAVDPGVGGGPPAPPTGAPSGDGSGTNVQAVTQLVLGTDPSTIYSIAYPVDGRRFATPDAPGHCKPRDGAKPLDVVVDGPLGEDNSFGKLVVPIVAGFSPDVQTTLDASIAAGSFSLLVRVDALGPQGSYAGLAAELFAADGMRDAAGKSIPPMDWANYAWEPVPSSLESTAGEGDALHSLVKFPSSWVSGDRWVSGAPSTLSFGLSISGQTLHLELRAARMSHALDASRDHGDEGVISGVLAAEALGESVRALAGKASPALCKGALIDTLILQIEGAADMMQDGTQDPSATCDGISIGLGYRTARSRIGKAAPEGKPSNPCP